MNASPRSSSRRLLVITVAAVLLITVTVLVVFKPFSGQTSIAIPPAVSSSSSCQADLLPVGVRVGVEVHIECVGVVTHDNLGSLADARVREMAQKIVDESDGVAKSGAPYVKVALLTPLTAVPGAAMSPAQIRYSLEGSYTALYRANHDEGAVFGDPNAVKLQMVLINFGSRQEYADDLLGRVLGQDEPAHPLVAVVGLGSSFQGTEEMAKELSERDIPMISAVASADTLSYPGLFSVSPSNTDYVLALNEFLREHGPKMKLTEGIIVADDQKGDPYVDTLRKAFLANLKTYVHRDPQHFRGGSHGGKAQPNVFAPVVAAICRAAIDPIRPIDMIFYAGRVTDFEVFAKRLKGRTCVEHPLAVLVGATGFHVAQAYKEVLDEGNITVVYASSADAPAWIHGENGEPSGFRSFYRSFTGHHFAESELTDGYAIMYHDAVASAAQATRAAVTEETAVPDPADVALQLKNVLVHGASGELSFSDRTNGRATGKIVVYRQVGTETVFQLPEHVGAYYTP